jgi:hypothetical protein
MTAKQYLQHYRSIEGRYKAAVEDYKNVENEMISLKSPSFGDKVQTSPQNDPIGEIVISLEKQKVRVGINIVKYRSQMLTVRKQITELENVDNDFCVILLLIYVMYKDWKFICKSLNVSRAQANVIHGRALQEFEKKYAETYLDF